MAVLTKQIMLNNLKIPSNRYLEAVLGFQIHFRIQLCSKFEDLPVLSVISSEFCISCTSFGDAFIYVLIKFYLRVLSLLIYAVLSF